MLSSAIFAEKARTSGQKKLNHGAGISVARERAKLFMSAAHLRILTTLPKAGSRKPFATVSSMK
jgi:hypothetical protein